MPQKQLGLNPSADPKNNPKSILLVMGILFLVVLYFGATVGRLGELSRGMIATIAFGVGLLALIIIMGKAPKKEKYHLKKDLETAVLKRERQERDLERVWDDENGNPIYMSPEEKAREHENIEAEYQKTTSEIKNKIKYAEMKDSLASKTKSPNLDKIRMGIHANMTALESVLNNAEELYISYPAIRTLAEKVHEDVTDCIVLINSTKTPEEIQKFTRPIEAKIVQDLSRLVELIESTRFTDYIQSQSPKIAKNLKRYITYLSP